MIFAHSLRYTIVIFLLVAVAGWSVAAVAEQNDINAIFDRAKQLNAAGKYDAAMIEAQRFEAAVKFRLGIKHPSYGAALEMMAFTRSNQGKYKESVALYEQAIAVERNAAGMDISGPLSNVGNALQNMGKYREAETAYKQAISVREQKQGAKSPKLVSLLLALGSIYLDEGRWKLHLALDFESAEDLYRRALNICEEAYGNNNPAIADPLISLAGARESQGKHAEAEAMLKRALVAQETAFGGDEPRLVPVLNSLGKIYTNEDEWDISEQTFRRAVAIIEASMKLGTADRAYLSDQKITALNGLYGVVLQHAFHLLKRGEYMEAIKLEEIAVGMAHRREGTLAWDEAHSSVTLANLNFALGRYGNAEALYKRAIEVFSEIKADDVGNALGNLGSLYLDFGRFDEAEPLLRRALEVNRVKYAKQPYLLDSDIWRLARLHQLQGRLEEAEAEYKRALAMREETKGNDFAVEDGLAHLGTFYLQEHRLAEAEPLLKRSAELWDEFHINPNSSMFYDTINNLANVYRGQRRYSEAEPLYRRALEIEKKFGDGSPMRAMTFNDLATLKAETGDAAQALELSRQASAILIEQDAREGLLSPLPNRSVVQLHSSYFQLHVANLARNASVDADRAMTFGYEAYQIAQWSVQSSAGAAVQQMAARFGAGNNALGGLVRNYQDLNASWNDRNKKLVAAVSKRAEDRDEGQIDGIRRELVDTERRLSDIRQRIEREFPQYAALAIAKPLGVETVQRLLRADEALAFFLVGEEESYVFAVTREKFDWKKIPLSSDALSRQVTTFRRGLSIDEIGKSAGNAKSAKLFDLGFAHELYTTLFGSVEPLLTDKAKLVVVPSGALTALPFNLLITDKPAIRIPDKMTGYRDAAWLIKRQAVTVLPSVASLKALRAVAQKGRATKPLVGFGDPQFDPRAPSAGTARDAGKIAARRLATRSYSEFFQGAGVDRDKLAHGLSPLPDTALELRAVAKDLGALPDDLHLGTEASEALVKRLPLADYRVVYFATHGLVAGDVKGVAEPSLALSLPERPSELDDGLLTASEVAQLNLNADWVVLSACNTVAGDKPGAEALSGLARAFFYAGARAILVSHWAVDSDAATRLATSTFHMLKEAPTMGRAEALRRAELAYLNDSSEPRNAYPAFWAPFELVGEDLSD